MKLKIGADPELFVSNGKRYVSPHTFIPGTKEHPHKVEDGAVQLDGFAAEFNIDPTEDDMVFIQRINHVMEQLATFLPENHTLECVPVATFGAGYIKRQPPHVRELGCNPDFNAYTMGANPPPNGEAPFRTGSGHLHFGWTEGQDVHDPDHFETCATFVRALDNTIGVYSVLEDQKGRLRRRMYGQAGCFRPKPYGVEYRVLSNFWVGEQEHTKTILKAARATFDMLVKGDGKLLHDKGREAINCNDMYLSSVLWEQAKEALAA